MTSAPPHSACTSAAKRCRGRDDHVLAAVCARHARLLFAGHRADHRGAQPPRPGAHQQPHAAGRRMHQQPRAGAHAAQVAQQHVGGQPLQQQRRGDLVVHRRRQAQHPVGRHAAHAAVGAGQRAEVGDAVAGQEARDAGADVEHRARGLHARRAAGAAAGRGSSRGAGRRRRSSRRWHAGGCAPRPAPGAGTSVFSACSCSGPP